MKKIKIAVLYKLTAYCVAGIFILLSLTIKAQISAPTATSTQTTSYTNGSSNDPIFIFCSPDINGNPVTGSLTATPPGGTPNWTFNWFTYNSGTNSWNPLSTQTNVPNSTITGLTDGGYRVVITDGSGTIVGCYRAWVWVINTTISVANIPPGCTPFSLNGTFSIANNSFSYYNPPADPFIIGPSTVITVCFNANHTFVSDIGFFLVGPPSCGSPTLPLAPNPQAINAANGCCCNSGNNVSNLCFSTANANMLAVCGAGTPLTGNYGIYGQGPPYSSNNNNWAPLYGCDATQGGWKVQIYDCIAADVGALTNVTITFTGNSSCGPSTITYNSGAINSTINDNSCSAASASIYTVPNPPPTVAQTLSVTSTFQWTSNPSITIPNATTSLTPSISPAPTQNTWFYLTTTNSYGCTNIDSALFVYTPPTAPTITPTTPFCINDAAVNLVASVSGGTWSGTGITNTSTGLFDPSVAGAGTFIITYTTPPPCGSPTTTTIIVNPLPIVTVPQNFSVCNGNNVAATNFTSSVLGTTYTWTNSNTTIGLVASGTGNIGTFTAANITSNPVTATITVTPTANNCVGPSSSYIITVNPTPTVVVPSNIIVCKNDSVMLTNFTSATLGVTYNWVNDNTAIGIGANGTGNIVTFPSANPTNLPITATITVTPTANGCVGISSSYTILVNPLPIANFTSDTACFGYNTTFTDNTILGAANITNWNWDFNNDLITDNTTQNPTYIFPSASSFPIYLNVIDANGCTDDTTITITVSPQPTAAFTFTNECFGSATGFTDLSNPNGGTITNWDWDFNNDGTVDNTTQNTSFGYPSANTYTAELLVTTSLGCVDSITHTIIVNPIPVANFSGTNECLSNLTIFTDSSTVITGTITNWQWNLGDAIGTDTAQNPVYTYANPNTYNVTLTVTSDSNCVNVITLPVQVYPNPTAAFTNDSVCLNVAATFTDLSIGNGGIINTWQWDIDNDGTTDFSTQNLTNLYPNAGSYIAQLIVTTTDGCSDSISKAVTIYPMPISNFSFINTCYGDSLNFTDLSNVSTGNIIGWNWDFGNLNSSTNQNPAEYYTSEGLFNTQLIVTTDHACQDTITKQIEVWPLPNVNFGPTSVCLNNTTQFFDYSTVSNLYTTNNIINWAWNFDDGTYSSFPNPIHTYSTAGVFNSQLIITTNNGCIDSLNLLVTVNPLPIVDFSADSLAGCRRVCSNFTDLSTIATGTNQNYLWNFGDGGSSANQNQNHCYDNTSSTDVQSFDVSLTVTSDSGCVVVKNISNMITVYPKPIASFTFNPIIGDIYRNKITFTDQSIIAFQWSWHFGDTTTAMIQNPVHEYADSGNYLITLFIKNVYECKDTIRQIIRINPDYAIWIPNVFTPDGDNLNDFFYAQGYGIKELNMLIFDRWGNLIFEGYQLNDKWDGTYKGKKVPTDVYVYKIKAKDVFNKWHNYKGRVTVLK